MRGNGCLFEDIGRQRAIRWKAQEERKQCYTGTYVQWWWTTLRITLFIFCLLLVGHACSRYVNV